MHFRGEEKEMPLAGAQKAVHLLSCIREEITASSMHWRKVPSAGQNGRAIRLQAFPLVC